mmetsp:Transcript_10912/g.17862  ORF Transcript_10912/g.17862 Transcript_10912/m.17862 type:complete len:322 (+) Transcript_10912:177-1142(+)|eukprot:CAMPEP_0184648780 /NCGR_PEP_ID=MMETSP0308-20130426/5997_1 /TAXON_ID=38269 /ORGANISM="Gloeochaete witrockiana, Strain SAG 46.84" /LENGTH=321 /DNA_ID=CAMNT_0027080945 /DNA_START=148 /DNA_END=1113 /DNA_ORIENTATION=+
MAFLDELSPVNKLLFPAPTPGYSKDSYSGELAWLGHPRSPCLVMPFPGARFVLVYLHGNAEDIGHSRPMLEALRWALQVSVIAVEYPGYGIFPGRPCEANVNIAVERIHNYLVDILKFRSDEIIIFGRSIGTGPATRLVARTGARALILMSPYTSIRGVVKHLLGNAASYLISDRFHNTKEISKVWCPVLILHGRQDTLIPWTHAQKLHDVCPSEIKQLHVSETMDHNMFDLDLDIVHPIQLFMIHLEEVVRPANYTSDGRSLAPACPIRLDPACFVPPVGLESRGRERPQSAPVDSRPDSIARRLLSSVGSARESTNSAR